MKRKGIKFLEVLKLLDVETNAKVEKRSFSNEKSFHYVFCYKLCVSTLKLSKAIENSDDVAVEQIALKLLSMFAREILIKSKSRFTSSKQKFRRCFCFFLFIQTSSFLVSVRQISGINKMMKIMLFNE